MTPEELKAAEEPTYIGDGVYAHFDGYQLWLTTPNQGRLNSIAIEPEVYHALRRYVANSHPEVRAHFGEA